MLLKPIERVEEISNDNFQKLHLQQKEPVILRNFVKGSAALTKWDYDYFKKVAGHHKVNLYGREDAFNDHATSPPVQKATFGEYLDMISSAPSELRLFLFNLLKIEPELKKDLVYNDPTGGKIVSWLPFMFFGGEGSSVRYHYDIDMSHIFLTQFKGVKRVLLFSQEQTPLLYKLPYNFHGVANLNNPADERYPALKYLKGWECDLQPGETLYIPSGYWHYIKYVTEGYSVSLRMLNESPMERLRGFRNIVITRRIDNTMRRLFNGRWLKYKLNQADNAANKAIEKLSKNSA
ncbi:cupin-like domain-containing protein [Mucilaginibacter limnophilus]|uniref:Cupin-like domain-containing protein n=1 Tax=Mucilaginibacter limnophilus TaxID=1932778 RepID=A0A3S2V037_9SPHI|nr:cupin-like domain-containing protein [Mucilaginibacter limnophilus]RVT98257.1 cupin-like domain-containing protein [Mucilaginibacter limnophilus]